MSARHTWNAYCHLKILARNHIQTHIAESVLIAEDIHFQHFTGYGALGKVLRRADDNSADGPGLYGLDDVERIDVDAVFKQGELYFAVADQPEPDAPIVTVMGVVEHSPTFSQGPPQSSSSSDPPRKYQEVMAKLHVLSKTVATVVGNPSRGPDHDGKYAAAMAVIEHHMHLLQLDVQDIYKKDGDDVDGFVPDAANREERRTKAAGEQRGKKKRKAPEGNGEESEGSSNRSSNLNSSRTNTNSTDGDTERVRPWEKPRPRPMGLGSAMHNEALGRTADGPE